MLTNDQAWKHEVLGPTHPRGLWVKLVSVGDPPCSHTPLHHLEENTRDDTISTAHMVLT